MIYPIPRHGRAKIVESFHHPLSPTPQAHPSTSLQHQPTIRSQPQHLYSSYHLPVSTLPLILPRCQSHHLHSFCHLAVSKLPFNISIHSTPLAVSTPPSILLGDHAHTHRQKETPSNQLHTLELHHQQPQLIHPHPQLHTIAATTPPFPPHHQAANFTNPLATISHNTMAAKTGSTRANPVSLPRGRCESNNTDSCKDCHLR